MLGSNTFVYRTFAFSGIALFEYGSYSLALYYFDRALKAFHERGHTHPLPFERKL